MKLFDSVRVTQVLGAFALFLALSIPGHVSAIGPADGEGELTVLPGTAVTGNTELEFQFDFTRTRNRPAVLLPGSQLRITVPGEWTMPQLTDPDGEGYVSIALGAGGGISGLNTCDDYNIGAISDPFITADGDDWIINIYQHCMKNDHLLVSYENVTAPAAGIYEFTGWTRATLLGGGELRNSPTITVSPVCEEGFHAEGVNCVANDPPFCPEGYVIGEGGFCYPDPIVEPEICPEGTTYNSETGDCEGSITDPEPCPEGLTFSEEEDKCVDTTPTESLPCPPGYTYNFDTCVDNENPDNPPVPVECPEGMELSEMDYMCYLPDEDITCAVGEYDAETNQCVVETVGPSCPANYTLTPSEVEGEAPMCVYVPFPPSCAEGFELNEDMTACFPDETPVCEQGTHLEGDACIPDEVKETDNGGGGGTNKHPSERKKDDGEVLGAETGPAGSCTPLLNEYLSEGKPGMNPDQVKALEEFLNKELGITLVADGVFDATTTKAVNDFQLKYAAEVLAPWVPFGLPNAETPTGQVYKLTLWKINSIGCAPVVLPTPTLP